MHPDSNPQSTSTETSLTPTPTPSDPTPLAPITRERRMVPRWTAITTGVAGLALGATLLGGAAFAQTPTADEPSADSDTGIITLQPDGPRQLRNLPLVGVAEDGSTTEARPVRGVGLFRFMKLDIVAETLGLTPTELNAQLEAGTALTDIITAQGSTVEAVVDALVAEAQEALDLAVSEERITQEEADERLAALPAELTERIESGVFLHRAGPGGPGGADCEQGMEHAVPADPGTEGESATPDAATPDTESTEDATPTTS